MIRNIQALLGYTIVATDGEIGRLESFFFDDATWMLRYAVVVTGDWLQQRRVLLAIDVLEQPDEFRNELPVTITQEKVRNSPPIDAAQPISRQHQIALHEYYDWPQYWTLSEDQHITGMLASVPEIAQDQPPKETTASLHLRDAQEVIGYQVHALDGEVGTVENFSIDDQIWSIRYLVVNGGAERVNKTVVIAPEWIQQIDWARTTVYVDLTIERIKTSPDFDLSSPIDREYENLLYAHYR